LLIPAVLSASCRKRNTPDLLIVRDPIDTLIVDMQVRTSKPLAISLRDKDRDCRIPVLLDYGNPETLAATFPLGEFVALDGGNIGGVYCLIGERTRMIAEGFSSDLSLPHNS
jgi:hypothetical protein